MCTAIGYQGRFFGRTLDYEHSFGQQIILTPREIIPLCESKNRYAMLGVGVVNDGLPMYFDGINEWGLCAAALNFPGEAVYHPIKEGMVNLSSAGLVPFILGLCRSVEEAKAALSHIVITNEPSLGIDPTPLHWIFCDKTGSITVESLAEGLSVVENPVEVLTNSPAFSYHITRLSDFMQLKAGNPENNLTKIDLPAYSRGMGALGLPGDFSSVSRFVRAVFLKENTRIPKEKDNEKRQMNEINSFFHIMSSVSLPLGSVVTSESKPVSTIYTCCADMEELTYYFKTYDSPTLCSVRLCDKLFDSKNLITYPMEHSREIIKLN